MRFSRLGYFSLALAAATAVMADEPPNVPPKPADADAPLAQGFPDATKPGEIEVKHYPAYRSAVASGAKVTPGASDLLFWPLFNHISKNHIAMTGPVISTYESPELLEKPGVEGRMTMEFVYRTPDQGKPGKAGLLVDVENHPAADYLCLGVQGAMNDDAMRSGVVKLRDWLTSHAAQWIESGPPRRLGYHGPMTPVAERLWEIQIPITPIKPAP